VVRDGCGYGGVGRGLVERRFWLWRRIAVAMAGDGCGCDEG
jgi:hypothetical protein